MTQQSHPKRPKKHLEPEVIPELTLPVTPLTAPSTPAESKMDSEDEIMSQASTEDFGDIEESDDGSLGREKRLFCWSASLTRGFRHE